MAWHYEACTNAPLSDYIKNLIFRELPLKKSYFPYTFDKRIYIDLGNSQGYKDEIEKPSRTDSKLFATIELKAALAKAMKLRAWGYANGEYLYMLVDGGLTLKYKLYIIKWQDNELEE